MGVLIRYAVLFLIGLWAAVSAQAATGDILSININTNGWRIEVEIEGLVPGGNTNGFYNTGFTNSTYNAADNALITLEVVDMGFDSTGAFTTITNTVYATWPIRKPYPDAEQIDEDANGGNVIVPLSLSRFVWNKTSNIVAQVSADFYNDGSNGNLAAADVAVVNNSEIIYPTAGMTSLNVPQQMITNTSYKVACAAFGPGANSGKPVACVRFIHSDGSTTITNDVTSMTLDADLIGISPYSFGAYVATVDLTGFTDNAPFWWDTIVFPWIGDTPLDTQTLGFTWPTQNPCTLTNYYDPDQDYGIVRARVDPINGDDTNGKAATEEYWASTGGEPTPFLTMGRAYVAIYNTNNTFYSHAHAGNSWMLLTNGDYPAWGSSFSVANVNPIWCNVTTQANCVATITNRVTDATGVNGEMIHMKGIRYLGTNTSTTIHASQTLWSDQCDIELMMGSAPFWEGNASVKTAWYLTYSYISNLNQSIRPVTTARLGHVPLIMGCTFSNFNGAIVAAGMVGCVVDSNVTNTSCKLTHTVTSQGWDYPYIPVIYNNYISAAGDTFNINDQHSTTNGYYLIQNVLQCTYYGAGTYVGSISSSGLNATNINLWHNVILGEKINAWYDWAPGSAPAFKYNCSMIGNIFDDLNTKSDNIAPNQSADEIGNWPIMFGVSSDGTIDLATTDVGLPTSAIIDDPADNLGFYGVNSWCYYTAFGDTTSTNYAVFTSRTAYDGVPGSKLNGRGDYTYKADSPLLGKGPSVQVLPFDLYGSMRTASDPPGVAVAPSTAAVWIPLGPKGWRR